MGRKRVEPGRDGLRQRAFDRADRRHCLHGPIFDSRRLHYNDIENVEESATSGSLCPSGDQRLTPEEIRQTADALADAVGDELAARGMLVFQGRHSFDPTSALRDDIAWWRQRYRCWTAARRAKVSGFVYLVRPRFARNAPVKIGRTASLTGRLVDLQRMSPVPLELVGLLHGGSLEGHLHERWSAHRLHGEWFDGAPLSGWINSLRLRSKCEGCL